MAKRKLKSGADAHEFTKEDAAKGGRARAESFQERRQAAEQAANEQLVSGLEKALKRLEGMLDSDNQQVAFRAVPLYLDRALGKAALPANRGRHEIARAEAVAIAKAELSKAEGWRRVVAIVTWTWDDRNMLGSAPGLVLVLRYVCAAAGSRAHSRARRLCV